MSSFTTLVHPIIPQTTEQSETIAVFPARLSTSDKTPTKALHNTVVPTKEHPYLLLLCHNAVTIPSDTPIGVYTTVSTKVYGREVPFKLMFNTSAMLNKLLELKKSTETRLNTNQMFDNQPRHLLMELMAMADAFTVGQIGIEPCFDF